MATRRFKQVDVFTSHPFLGNPVAVILDSDGLDTAAMQRIAAWTNLSETTFVEPATGGGADYAVRIFTPRGELPFAGHPTLGTAHAVLEAGIATPRDGRLVQSCGAGLVALDVGADFRRDGARLRVPPHRATTLRDDAVLARLLGPHVVGDAQAIDLGPVWVTAELASPSAVAGFACDQAALDAWSRAARATGLTIYAREPGSGDVVLRSFAPAAGIAEDPVCGSGNAAVAAHRLVVGTLAPGSRYAARQGREVGRDGRIEVRVDADGAILIGGVSVTCVDGTLVA